MSLIDCKNVALAYDGRVVAEKLTFTINEGDYLCIVGENGSGKSTLMKSLLGIVKPIDGAITYGDGLKPSEIGYMPQQTSLQRDFPASVYEIVLSGTLNRVGMRPFYTASEKRTALENIELLGLRDKANKSYAEFSGGQQQRVLLARALCATKKLLLLDEPTAGLDPVVTAELYRIIEMLNKEKGITVVMISHDIEAAVNSADHILHMYREPMFFGKTEDYLKTDVAKAFLGCSDGKEKA